MAVTRKGVEFAKIICLDRRGVQYVYGGTWNPDDKTVGCDCSGLVTDECAAVCHGTDMIWGREGISTETWRLDPQRMWNLFGAVRVTSPGAIPANAAVKIALHHGPGGGANSHMWCEVDGWRMESNGSHGCVMFDDARAIDDPYANDWYFIPGPIAEDGTPRLERPAAQMTDTFFADVSEFQVPVDDSYPYPVLSIRVSDGTYRDHKFPQNYAWMRRALDDGRLAFGIVYTYVRPNWQGNAQTLRSMIDGAGGLHDRVALMLDVESGGNPAGDGSAWINALHDNLVDYCGGNAARVIGYANKGDFNGLWRTRPPGLRVIAAGYGANPKLPGQVAHQYTDGVVGANQGLPMGCSPFGHCDMNVADGLSPNDFAAACGIGSPSHGGISMADAQSLKDEFDGVANGQPLPWRQVHMLRDAQIGDLSTQTDGDAELPNASPSVFDQTATLAKILTRRYKGHDVFDMLALIGDKLGVL